MKGRKKLVFHVIHVIVIAVIALSFAFPKISYAGEWVNKEERSDNVYQGTAGDNTVETDSLLEKLEQDVGILEKYFSDWLADMAYTLIYNQSEEKNGIDFSIDAVVLGRLGENIDVSYMQFELAEGNPWGLIGSAVYYIIAGSCIALALIYLLYLLVQHFWKSGQRERSELKEVATDFVFKFLLIFCAYKIVDYGYYFRDVMTHTLLTGVSSMFHVNISDNVSIMDTFLMGYINGGKGVINALFLIASVCAGYFFMFNYIGTALIQTIAFGALPCAIFGSIKNKRLLSAWTATFLSNLAIPMIDAVILIMPNLIGVIAEQNTDGLGDSFGIAVIKLAVIWGVIPARNALLRTMCGSVQPASGMRGLAGMALMAARLLGSKKGTGILTGKEYAKESYTETKERQAVEELSSERFNAVNNDARAHMNEDIRTVLDAEEIPSDSYASDDELDRILNNDAEEIKSSDNPMKQADEDILKASHIDDVYESISKEESLAEDDTYLSEQVDSNVLQNNRTDDSQETSNDIRNSSKSKINPDEQVEQNIFYPEQDLKLDKHVGNLNEKPYMSIVSADTGNQRIQEMPGMESRKMRIDNMSADRLSEDSVPEYEKSINGKKRWKTTDTTDSAVGREEKTIKNPEHTIKDKVHEKVEDLSGMTENFAEEGIYLDDETEKFINSLEGADRDRYQNLIFKEQMKEKEAEGRSTIEVLNAKTANIGKRVTAYEEDNRRQKNIIKRAKEEVGDAQEVHDEALKAYRFYKKENRGMQGNDEQLEFLKSNVQEMQKHLESVRGNASETIRNAQDRVEKNQMVIEKLNAYSSDVQEEIQQIKKRNRKYEKGIENAEQREHQYALNYKAAGMDGQVYISPDGFKADVEYRRKISNLADFKNFDNDNFRKHLTPEQRAKFYSERAMKQIEKQNKSHVGAVIGAGTAAIAGAAAAFGGPEMMGGAAVFGYGVGNSMPSFIENIRDRNQLRNQAEADSEKMEVEKKKGKVEKNKEESVKAGLKFMRKESDGQAKAESDLQTILNEHQHNISFAEERFYDRKTD